VRYLAGDIPPKEYELKPFSAIQAVMRSGPDGDESDELDF
jgi:hypothetical protein